ncbi:MAG: ABC transporter ATP-binding protein [Deltaproteobacteria bacterium]|nr:ABC transporter ATP-binding protein [Deltaproteobacteria bacterium]
MAPSVLQLLNVGKSIKGKEIVRDLNLELAPGEIFGFLGPNGAGKTTTIRMIVGLIKPTLGTIHICGFSLSDAFTAAMANVGCIIENPDMYDYLTGRENLVQYANMDARITGARIAEAVELVGLEHRIDDKVGIYSLGMKQRLGIAQAILARPKLLILDEPTSGLDPAGMSEFRQLMRSLAYEEGMAIFLSSHLLHEAQLMCDKVAIIKQGRIIKTCAVDDLLTGTLIEWEVDDPARAIRYLKTAWDIEAETRNLQRIQATIADRPLDRINAGLVGKGIALTFCCPLQHSLEELFLDLTKGDEIV